MTVLKAADLFCGAGGTSTGLLKAVDALGYKVDLVAVNHWDLAIDTHSMNHPGVRHVNSNLEKVDPRELVPGGHLDILVGSPECTYYSTALGGKPINNQSRATPKWILKWLTVLDVDVFILENVPEFRTWGPIHSCSCGSEEPKNPDPKMHKKGYNCLRPIKSRKGQYFRQFQRKIESLGYTIEVRDLLAADYGDPQSRTRLFMVGWKGDKKPTFPEPTHHEKGGDLRGKKKMWKTARTHVIDWSNTGESIFTREKPLVENTMRKIMQGLQKFGGDAFMMSNQSGAVPRHVDSLVPTVTASGSISLFEPFIVQLDQSGGNGVRVRSVDRPLNTLTSADAMAVCRPFLMQLDNKGNGTQSVDEPVKDLPTSDVMAIARPFLVEYYGNGNAHGVDEPVPTVTGNDRFGLVMPVVQDDQGTKYIVDIRYRMFTIEEYMKAMSLPEGYELAGTSRKSKVKMIGNMVPVELACALAKHNIEQRIAV